MGIFILALLNGDISPNQVSNLVHYYEMDSPDGLRWHRFSDQVDKEISLFRIVDLASLRRYENWRFARWNMAKNLVPLFDHLTFNYLNAMATGNQETLPEEYKSKLFSEIEQLRTSLDNRIPEFGVQLQVVLGRLQELPEAAWALTQEQRKTIVDGFKMNANVVVFREAKTTSIKNHKIKGDISPDMF